MNPETNRIYRSDEEINAALMCGEPLVALPNDFDEWNTEKQEAFRKEAVIGLRTQLRKATKRGGKFRKPVHD